MMHISNVSKMVHDKVTNNSHFKAMRYNCEGGPINAMAVNKDFSQVVVAGRSIFKILDIKEDGFSENMNLRVAKNRNINLSYSAADVAWHPSDENILASAATNGDVVLWNLNKVPKSKQVMIYTEHKRSVNRVAFHSAEHNQLLSASQDGVVMIHDVRKPTVCSKFVCTDSVRDAQFCPHSGGYFTFAATYENGGVQTWDMRRPDRCERQFTAHTGPVFSLDWHMGDKTWWLATAGRDRMIKVWDMVRGADRGIVPKCLYSITTIENVARVKWRPHRKHHISSCSLLGDHCINVWDVGRPYIPFASFDGHADVATCVHWREDCHAFLSGGRDGYIMQHVFTDARRPADHVNLASVDLSICGDIGCTFYEKKDQGSSGRSKKVSRSHQFTQASSDLCVFQNCTEEFDTDGDFEDVVMPYFVEVALGYKLEGASLVDMCLHNAEIAQFCRKPQVAVLWRMLAILYAPCVTTQKSSNHISRPAPLATTVSQPERQEHTDLAVKSAMKRPREKEKKKTLSQIEATSGSSSDSSEAEGESSEVDKSAPELNTEINFFFGDGGEDLTLDMYSTEELLESNHFKIQNVPVEAFQPRHELTTMTGTHPLIMDESEYVPIVDSVVPCNETTDHSSEPTLVVKQLHDPEPLCFSTPVADIIKDLAEEGDVQTVVSVLIVLGDHIRASIDEAYQESWFFAYIDLLGRYELWTIANVVIKQSKLMGVCTLNHESTVIHTLCSRCLRPCERAAWLCDKCKRVTNVCSVCHSTVIGLMVWCQGCCHGGHLEHIEEWLQISNKCPAGCGHMCEYV